MNGDGIDDIITGSYYGDENVRTRADGSPRRDENGDWWGDIFIFYGNKDDSFGPRQLLTNAIKHPTPFPVDWDNDGDYDFVTTTWGERTYKGQISLMENIGSKTEPKFAYPVPLVSGEHYASVVVYDWDGDGLQDLIAGGYMENSIFFFRNTGTKELARFDKRETLIQGIKSSEKWHARTSEEAPWGNALHLYLTDWDGDGVMDILAGGNDSRRKPLYSLSAEERRKLTEIKARVDAFDEAYYAKRRELYADIDQKTLTKEEARVLAKKATDFREELLKEYPTYEQDRKMVWSKMHLIGSGRIWLFRGVK